mmetsp:Transcript_8765/g.24960  ORF Transcript_8765/g.24960 Transcript_8765/m.24960 type:complete len:233 (-) Transcript_8765:1597-2295(-)
MSWAQTRSTIWLCALSRSPRKASMRSFAAADSSRAWAVELRARASLSAAVDTSRRIRVISSLAFLSSWVRSWRSRLACSAVSCENRIWLEEEEAEEADEDRGSRSEASKCTESWRAEASSTATVALTSSTSPNRSTLRSVKVRAAVASSWQRSWAWPAEGIPPRCTSTSVPAETRVILTMSSELRSRAVATSARSDWRRPSSNCSRGTPRRRTKKTTLRGAPSSSTAATTAR